MEAFLRENGSKSLCDGLVDAVFVAINREEVLNVGELRRKLRENPVKREKGRTIYYYVVDGEERLVGVISTAKLNIAFDTDELNTVMTLNPYAMQSSATLSEAVDFLRLSTYRALPVVSEGRLLGTFSWEYLHVRLKGVPVSVEQQEVEIDRLKRDLSRLLGWDPNAMQMLGAWGAFKLRCPWLLVTMTAGLICAATIHRYEGLLASLPLIAAFIPLVLALADAVCHQASSITILDDHAGERRGWKALVASLWKELRVSAAIGFAACALLVIFIACWQMAIPPALAVGFAVALSICGGGFIGHAIPTVLRRLRRDPHVSGGPVALALTDVVATFLLLEVSRLLLT